MLPPIVLPKNYDPVQLNLMLTKTNMHIMQQLMFLNSYMQENTKEQKEMTKGPDMMIGNNKVAPMPSTPST